MFTLEQYLKSRRASMPHYTTRAVDAMRHLRFTETLNAWRKDIDAPAKLYTNSENIAHTWQENGYTFTLKIEYDENDYSVIECQGYGVKTDCRAKPEFAEHGEFTRHSGDGIEAFIDVAERDVNYYWFDLSEKYMRQYYDNRGYGRHAAYTNMVASSRMAVKQDIKCFLQTQYYTVVCEVTDSHGEEIFSDCLGGCDEDYAISGEAFMEHGMVENAREAVVKDLIAWADRVMESRPDMYAAQA